MKHFTEDELVLYFYGESRRAGQIDRHLGDCERCSALYGEIAATLALINPPETPARDEDYGERVWRRIRHQLQDQEPVTWVTWLSIRRVRAAACAAVLVAIASGFLVATHGRRAAAPSHAATPASADAADATARVRLAAISDHLDESERVLMDLLHTHGQRVDLSAQQAAAESLIESNRLYRDAAARAGEGDVAALLDELERSLLDIVHEPPTLTVGQLNRAITRLNADALLFRIRVLSDELRERKNAPAKPRTTL